VSSNGLNERDKTPMEAGQCLNQIAPGEPERDMPRSQNHRKPFSVLENIYTPCSDSFGGVCLDHLPPLLAFIFFPSLVCFLGGKRSEFWPCFVLSFETQELYP